MLHYVGDPLEIMVHALIVLNRPYLIDELLGRNMEMELLSFPFWNRFHLLCHDTASASVAKLL